MSGKIFGMILEVRAELPSIVQYNDKIILPAMRLYRADLLKIKEITEKDGMSVKLDNIKEQLRLLQVLRDRFELDIPKD